MLRFIDEIIGMPIMSIRGGRQISTTIQPILNAHKMRLEGFYCEDRAAGIDKILLVEDIREYSGVGIIVDSEDTLMEPNDLVRLESVLDMNFDLIHKTIVTESGKKVGRVDNYVYDDVSAKIEKIHGRPTAMRTLSTNDYIISRRQIASVNEKELIVKDATVGRGSKAKRPSFSPLRG